MVRQCPRCELRFRDEAELRAHLVDDHGVDPESLEHRYRGEEDPPPTGRAR
ncbi:MAG: hypothetical protein M3O86_02255 [Actinomycetota bacterium]|nr:hypothetical protein [Actinomycetota bacterium]